MKNNEFINAYLTDLIAEAKESDLEKSSTELVDETKLSEIIDESLGKWLKNTFTKFTKGSKEQEMLKTLNNVCEKFQLKPQRINGTLNPNIVRKSRTAII